MEDENRGSPMTQETPIGFLYSKVGNPPMGFPAMFDYRSIALGSLDLLGKGMKYDEAIGDVDSLA